MKFDTEFIQLSKQIMADYIFTRIDGQLCWWFEEEKIYRRCVTDIDKDGDVVLLASFNEKHDGLTPDVKKKLLEEVRIMKMAEIREDKHMAPYYCPFQNGVVDVRTGELHQWSPDDYFTYRIPHFYDPEAPAIPAIDDYMEKVSCGDKQVQQLLWESLGYTFYGKPQYRTAFILQGIRGTGKSTWLRLMESCIGKANISNLDLKQLSEEFKTGILAGRMANIGDDIDSKYIADTSMIKKLISGERVSARFKFGNEFEFTPTAKFYFSANEVPAMADPAGGMADRLKLIPFNHDFNSERIAGYDDKMVTEEGCQYAIRRAIEAFREVLKRDKFTSIDIERQALQRWKEENDPFLAFVIYRQDTDAPIYEVSIKALYQAFLEWAKAEGMQSQYKKSSFRHGIINVLGGPQKVVEVKKRCGADMDRVFRKVENTDKDGQAGSIQPLSSSGVAADSDSASAHDMIDELIEDIDIPF